MNKLKYFTCQKNLLKNTYKTTFWKKFWRFRKIIKIKYHETKKTTYFKA